MIERVKQGDFALVDLEKIARSGAVQAIPVLEKQFAATEDATVKGKMAFALGRLGDKNESYWNYLAEQASLAIGSDMPDPNDYDAQGKLIPGPSPEFTAWAKAHKLTEQAAETLYGDHFRDLMFLEEAEDPRAIPCLRQALLSSNFALEIIAADGLVDLQDKASIPLIVDACQRAPAEVAQGMARDLLKFDD
ncbi:MAG: HEAT repeat domain-containing protein, partial [Acidobacteriaceae bacterium]|nr:HEAT repeat domain-containing protein [Acidobacteriaceae bacterium]